MEERNTLRAIDAKCGPPSLVPEGHVDFPESPVDPSGLPFAGFPSSSPRHAVK